MNTHPKQTWRGAEVEVGTVIATAMADATKAARNREEGLVLEADLGREARVVRETAGAVTEVIAMTEGDIAIIADIAQVLQRVHPAIRPRIAKLAFAKSRELFH